jgi:hypothetical protein
VRGHHRSDSLGNFIAVEARQTNVDQRHVGPHGNRRVHAARSVLGFVNLVAGQFEGDAKTPPYVSVVIDDENATKVSWSRVPVGPILFVEAQVQR